MALNQLVWCKAEQARILDDQRTARLVGCELHLFVNNITIDRDTVLGDFAEAAWTGYAAQTLSTWAAVGELGDGVRVATLNGDNPTFANSSGGAQTFYGWFLTDGSGNYLGGAQCGATSIPDGAAVQVTVQATQRSEYTSSP